MVEPPPPIHQASVLWTYLSQSWLRGSAVKFHNSLRRGGNWRIIPQTFVFPCRIMEGQPQEWLHRHSIQCWTEFFVVLSSAEFRSYLQRTELVDEASSGEGEEVTGLNCNRQTAETSPWFSQDGLSQLGHRYMGAGGGSSEINSWWPTVDRGRERACCYQAKEVADLRFQLGSKRTGAGGQVEASSQATHQ